MVNLWWIRGELWLVEWSLFRRKDSSRISDLFLRIPGWVQDEFLDAPVEEFGDVEDVLRGAGDLVDPTELLELFAGLAEDA